MPLLKSYIKRHNSMARLLAGNLLHLSVYLTSFSSVFFHLFHLPLTWDSAEDYILDPLIDFRINEFTITLIRCSLGTLAEGSDVDARLLNGIPTFHICINLFTLGTRGNQPFPVEIDPTRTCLVCFAPGISQPAGPLRWSSLKYVVDRFP